MSDRGVRWARTTAEVFAALDLQRAVFAEQGVDPSRLATAEEPPWDLLFAGPPEKPLAMIALRMVDREPGTGRVASAAVVPAARDGVLALTLMTHAVNELHRRGADRVRIAVMAWKRSLIASYGRLGFKECPRTETPAVPERVDLLAAWADLAPHAVRVEEFLRRRGRWDPPT